MGCGGGGSEGEAEIGASSENIRDRELAADVVSGVSASVIIGGVNGGEEDAVKFGDISDEEVSELVFDPRGAVGKDDDWDTVGVGVVDDEVAEEFRADTFFVIGEDECVDTAAEGVMNEGREFIEGGVGVMGVVVEVESEDLVIFRDDAGFGGSGVVSEDEAAGGDMELEE